MKKSRRKDSPIANVKSFILLAAMLPTYDEAEELTEGGKSKMSIATGLSDLDAITGGLHRGNLILLAGGAGMAKSTICQNIARLVALRHEFIVALFNLESSNAQVIKRIMSAEAKVDSHDFPIGKLNEDGWTQVAMVVQGLYDSYLAMDDRLHKSVTDIGNACEELRSHSQIDLIIIDSIPLITESDEAKDVLEVARSLKIMARTFNAPVVAVSHLYTDGMERRADRRPIIGDLAGIESYADEVMLTHRVTPNGLTQHASMIEELEVIIAKQSNGPIGMVRLAFLPQQAWIGDMGEIEDEPTGF